MTDSTSNQSRWHAIVGVLGIAAAVGWFVWIQPRPVHPLGSDWGHHFTVAEFIWHPSTDIGYPLFHKENDD